MKRFELSRVTPFALSAALSLALTICAADALSSLGMKAAESLKASHHVAPPLLAQSHRVCAANAVCVRAS
jgi:hypothetical protein